MKRWAVGTAALLAAGLGLLQFFPAERSNPPVEWEIDPPAEVGAILRRACYDCHSHTTRWPWYSRVAPVSWWVTDHVEHARRDLNFSRWPLFDFEARGLALRSIEEQIKTEQMPLPSYLILHTEARLSEDDRRILVEWARSSR